jgi:hypothetical protein
MDELSGLVKGVVTLDGDLSESVPECEDAEDELLG